MEQKNKKIKAVAMLSGGLDSRIAVRMVQEQGVDVVALNYVTPFCTCTSKSSCRLEAKKASVEYGIELKTFYVFEDFIHIIREPKHGSGSGINPCLDCRILMFKKAKEYMDEMGASFLVTGEVLGERPMSQRPDAMITIENESGLSGLIVRPLSAKLLKPSIPEERGWVDRKKFLEIEGRSRKPQIEMAEKLGMGDYPCPAGGCLLTDKDFSRRMSDLLSITDMPSRNDVFLLKVGRQRFYQGKRIVIGRNEKENQRITSLAREKDLLMEAADFTGPTTLIRGDHSDDIILEAARLTGAYGKGRDEAKLKIKYWSPKSIENNYVEIEMKESEDLVIS